MLPSSQAPRTESRASQPAMIDVRGLSKVFGTISGEDVKAIDDITLIAAQREFTVIVGPSGCGKTTLLRILGGLIPHTKGEVLVDGSPVKGPRKDVGMVFQAAVLLPWRSVLDNILVPVEIQRLPRERYVPKARELLELVGLSGFENKYPHELSGGMQQRVSICRALVHDPALLLMDEPFGALDAMTRESMNLELQKIWLTSAKTILFITHGIQEAVFLGDRVLVMSPRPGKIVADIRVDESRPRSFAFMESASFGQLTARVRKHIMSKGAIE